MSASFVNVDLEIESPDPLDYLALEFADLEIRRLYCGETKGGYLATFECNQIGGADPNSLIETFCGGLVHLDERATKLWNAAHRKTFDIGYEADAEVGSFRSEIKNEVARAVADAGASIVITIYPRPNSEQDASPQAD